MSKQELTKENKTSEERVRKDWRKTGEIFDRYRTEKGRIYIKSHERKLKTGKKVLVKSHVRYCKGKRPKTITHEFKKLK